LNRQFSAIFICGLLAAVNPTAWAREAACGDPGLEGFSAQRLERVSPVMQSYVDQGRLAGIVSLIARNGNVVHHEAFGDQEIQTGKPMELDSIFRIYSMTKPVTSVAAMILYEEGRFQLSDPISKYLPEFAQLQVYAGGEGADASFVQAQSPVTIKHLLTHTSGFIYGVADNEVGRRYRQANMFEPGLSLEQLTARLATLPLAHQPGTAWKYGFSTDVLGRLIEVISGQSLDVFMQQRIFEPLGMKDTGFHVPEEKWERLGEVYGWGPENSLIIKPREQVLGEFESPPALLSGGHGLVSTASDYWRFAQMLSNKGSNDGVRILGRKTVEYMTVNHLPADMVLINADTPGAGFGLGFYVVVDVSRTKTIESLGNYGWGGYASTFFWVDPVENLVGLVLTQFVPFGFHPYHENFRVLTYQALVDGGPGSCESIH